MVFKKIVLLTFIMRHIDATSYMHLSIVYGINMTSHAVTLLRHAVKVICCCLWEISPISSDGWPCINAALISSSQATRIRPLSGGSFISTDKLNSRFSVKHVIDRGIRRLMGSLSRTCHEQAVTRERNNTQEWPVINDLGVRSTLPSFMALTTATYNSRGIFLCLLTWSLLLDERGRGDCARGRGVKPLWQAYKWCSRQLFPTGIVEYSCDSIY